MKGVRTEIDAEIDANAEGLLPPIVGDKLVMDENITKH